MKPPQELEHAQRSRLLRVIGAGFMVLGVLQLVYGAFILPARPQLLKAMQENLSVPGIFLTFGLTGFMGLVVGRGIYLGANWARWLYVVWNTVGILLSLTVMSSKPAGVLMSIPGALLFVVLTYVLFRKSSSAHFTSAEPKQGRELVVLVMGLPSLLVFVVFVYAIVCGAVLQR
jgi:hypothetical protein